MNENDIEPIKYRLVGASVIVISFMLAWWLLLDHEVHRYQGEEMIIPEPLVIERFTAEKPKKPGMEIDPEIAGSEKPVLPKEKVPVSENSKSTNETKGKIDFPSLGEQGLPDAWVIQVGSFEDKDKANGLKKTLLADEFPAYVKPFAVKGGKTSYRVLVGPKLSRQRADTMLSEIAKKHGQKGIIIKFKPGFEQ